MSSGQRGSGEEGHSCFGTVLNKWPGVRVHYQGVIWPHQKTPKCVKPSNVMHILIKSVY